MKRLVLTGGICLLAIAASAQVPVPYIFVPNTPASATQVNENFKALSDNALHASSGKLTGNLTVDPGVTIDGVDISEVFGGTGKKTLTADGAKLISTTMPQLIVGYDPTHNMSVAVDAAGGAIFDLQAPGQLFEFRDPILAKGGLVIPDTVTFNCTACVNATQLASSAVTAGAYGNGTTVGTFTVDTDGRLIAASNVAIAFPAPPAYANIPETAIIDGALLARINSNDTIAGTWIFTNLLTVGGLNSTTHVRAAADSGAIAQYVSVADATGGNAPAYFQSGEPGVDATNVILSNNYYGINGSASGRRNTSAAGSYIQLRRQSLTLNAITSAGVASTVFSATTGQISTHGNPLFVGNGTGVAPGVRFAACVSWSCGVFYNPTGGSNVGLPSNPTIEIGARFNEDAVRSGIRTFDNTARVDFMVGSVIPISMVPYSTYFHNHVRANPTDTLLLGDGLEYFYAVQASSRAGGGFIVVSDVRLKNNLGPIKNALDAIEAVSPFLATFKTPNKTDPHLSKVAAPTFSAQEIAERLDKRLGTGIVKHDAKTDTWGMDYNKLTPILWQGTKELNAKVKTLEAKVEAQTLALAALEIRLAKHKH